MELKCRLCSSESALISVFNGKCRQNRDYIRKLVEHTTGIKFEKNDTFKCICYPCTVQVYNFYIFKTRSIENENILEAHVKKKEVTKSNKMEILNLNDIILPEIDDIQNILRPWLVSKSKCVETINSENGDSTIVENSLQHEIFNSECRTVEKSTQCDTVQHFDESSQCVSPNIAVQYTQTYTVTTKSIHTQCLLISNFDKPRCSIKDSFTQTEWDIAGKSPQYINSYNKDLKSHIPNLIDIKYETKPTSTLQLSPRKSQNVSKAIFSPIRNFSSPISNNRPEANRSKALCQECEQIFYTKEDYKLHRKLHMVCRFCNRKFLSIKRTNWHVTNECNVAQIMNKEPIVQLTRLERMQQVRHLYPQCIEKLKGSKKVEEGKSRPIVRMRSRSTSSADSFYSCCSICKNSWTILNSLKVGLNKSVQTNFPSFLNNISSFKSKNKVRENSLSPSKKAKLSFIL